MNKFKSQLIILGKRKEHALPLKISLLVFKNALKGIQSDQISSLWSNKHTLVVSLLKKKHECTYARLEATKILQIFTGHFLC